MKQRSYKSLMDLLLGAGLKWSEADTIARDLAAFGSAKAANDA